jgi:Protein of unknown function (DUF2490)
MKKILILVLFANYAFPQDGLGTWNVLNFSVKINPKWSAFAETQLRSLSFYDQFHYYEYKSGVSLKLNPTISITTGIGSYNTFSEGGNFELPAQNRETRTWFQVNMKNTLGKISFDHRYRAEQRFTSNGYKNRFRYRLSAIMPLNNDKIIPKTLYLSAWNEIFFTNKEPFFERNRYFIGLGYEVSNQLAIQTGYIHQFDYKINDETGRDFLNIALLYTIDLNKKNPTNYVPSTTD